jgi:hypothetical protein
MTDRESAPDEPAVRAGRQSDGGAARRVGRRGVFFRALLGEREQACLISAVPDRVAGDASIRSALSDNGIDRLHTPSQQRDRDDGPHWLLAPQERHEFLGAVAVAAAGTRRRDVSVAHKPCVQVVLASVGRGNGRLLTERDHLTLRDRRGGVSVEVGVCASGRVVVPDRLLARRRIHVASTARAGQHRPPKKNCPHVPSVLTLVFARKLNPRAEVPHGRAS